MNSIGSNRIVSTSFIFVLFIFFFLLFFFYMNSAGKTEEQIIFRVEVSFTNGAFEVCFYI